MLVGEILVEAQTVEMRETIADAAQKMRSTSVGCLIVLNSGEVVGVLTERNIALGCPVEGHISWECQVYQHMTIQSVTAHPRMDASSATIIMMDNETDCLPVLENGKLVGLVCTEDISASNDRQFAYESEMLSLSGVG